MKTVGSRERNPACIPAHELGKGVQGILRILLLLLPAPRCQFKHFLPERFRDVLDFSPYVLKASVPASYRAYRNAWLCNVVHCGKLKAVFPSGHRRASFQRNVKPAVGIPVCKSMFFTGCQERMCCRCSLLVIKTWRFLTRERLKCFLRIRIGSQSVAGARPALAATD